MKATLKQLLTEEEKQSIFFDKPVEELTVKELNLIGNYIVTPDQRFLITEHTSIPAFAIIKLTARAMDKNLNILEP